MIQPLSRLQNRQWLANLAPAFPHSSQRNQQRARISPSVCQRSVFPIADSLPVSVAECRRFPDQEVSCLTLAVEIKKTDPIDLSNHHPFFSSTTRAKASSCNADHPLSSSLRYSSFRTAEKTYNRDNLHLSSASGGLTG